MSNNSYWSQLLYQRVSRRRTLAASGASVVGAAILAACGSDDSGKGKESASGLITQPVDTSKQAVRGGTMKTYSKAYITHYDVHNTQQGGQGFPGYAYSRYVIVEPGYLADTDYLKIMPDIGESWEYSPDGLTLTMKLRQGAGWAPMAPVNGRPVDIEDVAYTWKRWVERGSNRSDHLNSLNPDAPVLSFSTPDSRTMVWKLAYPTSLLLPLMAGGPKTPYIIPKESETQYDLRTVPIGSGPFYATQFAPDIGWTLKRNPNFYDKERPYIETVERPVIPEYAAAEAQFRIGGIYDFEEIRDEQILPMKAEVPELRLYSLPVIGRSSAIYFGWKPVEGNIFRDVRVRRALSMSWDRDTWIDVFRNVSTFEAAGIPMETRWNTGFDCEFTGWWLDPKSKDFGPNAAIFKHNVAEAKKLLSAAGFANGTPEIDSVWPPTGQGLDFGKWVAALEGMAAEAGFRFKTHNADLNTEWIQKYRDANGNFEGIVWRNQGLVGGDPVNQLASEYMSTKGNIRFSGFDPDGRGDYSGDPALEDMINKAKREFDVEAQRSIVKEVQRYLARYMYDLWFPGGATGLKLLWPVVANHQVYDDSDASMRRSFYQWIDPTQPPLKKA